MLVRYALEMLAPMACYGCGAVGSSLCLTCLRGTLEPYGGRCYRCLWGSASGAACIDCCRTAPLLGLSVVTRYTDPLRRYIHELKHRPDRRLAQVLAQLLVRRVLQSGRSFDAVIAIPTAPARYHERGYNQTELLARAVAGELGLPCRHDLLRLNARHQVGSDRTHRFDQIRGVFAARVGTDLLGMRLLVIDDVMTTGATLEEAAIVLCTCGAASVWGGVVARA